MGIFSVHLYATITDSGRAFFLSFHIAPPSAERRKREASGDSSAVCYPVMELALAGKEKRESEWGYSAFSRFSSHRKRRTLHVQAQLQACRLAHLTRMPRWIKHHLDIQFLNGRQS